MLAWICAAIYTAALLMLNHIKFNALIYIMCIVGAPVFIILIGCFVDASETKSVLGASTALQRIACQKNQILSDIGLGGETNGQT